MAEDLGDLISVALLEGHPYRKTQHYLLPYLLCFQRFFKRRQRHGLVAIGADRDHSNPCARFLLNKLQIILRQLRQLLELVIPSVEVCQPFFMV